MKKLLSVVLVLAMMLSLVVVSIPASAEDEAVSEFKGTVVVTDTATLEEDGYKPIETAEQLLKLTSGNEAESIYEKYYLANDITLEAAGNGGNLTFAVINGNGHTVTFAGTESIVNWGKNVTIENLYLTGSVEVKSNGQHYGALCVHGFDGTVVLRNIHSDVEIKLTKDMDGAIGGLVGKLESSDLTIDNVSFTGKLDAGTYACKNGAERYQGIGGIAGWAQNGIITNVYVDAEITAANTAYIGLGGAFGLLTTSNVKGATVKGSVASTGAFSGVGGFLGVALKGNVKIENVENNAAVTNGGKSGKAGVGGIVGAIKEGTLTVKNSTNNGAVTAKEASWDEGVAGIVGSALGVEGAKTKAVLNGAVNNGTVTAEKSAYTGGIAGILWGADYDFDNCVNNGAVAAPAGGDVGGMAGVLNAAGTLDYCVNKGTVTGVALVAGIVGQFYQGTSGALTNCVNAGIVTNTAADKSASGLVQTAGCPVTIDNCANIGAVAAANANGLATEANVTITNSVDASIVITNPADIATLAAVKPVADLVGSKGTTSATPAGSKGTTSATPVAADFDYATAYPEADGWIAVTDLAGLKAMANNGGKYYLKNNIEVNEGGFNGWKNGIVTELAGNGFTLTWKDTDATLFGGGADGSLTVYDLNIDGTMTVTAEVPENVGPILKHGYSGGVTLRNVHSKLNIVFAETVKEIKNAVGGIIAKNDSNATFENVSYTGTITVAAKQSQTYCEGIGGIAGGVLGTLTANNVTVDATISAAGEGNMYAGGVAGKVGSAVITNATVKSNITVAGEGDKAAGAVIGKVNNNIDLSAAVVFANSDCAVKGDVYGVAKTANIADSVYVLDGTKNWIAISDFEGLKALANDGGYYYLTNNIDVTAGGFNGWKNGISTEFAGNGYTLTWKDADGTLFGGGNGSVNVHDINLAGTFKVNSNFENAGPLLKHGYSGGLTLTNVHSTVNVVFTENAKEIKNAAGGICGKTEGPNVWNNVSYIGTMTIAAKETDGYAPGFGGIAGGVKGTLIATDVTVSAKIAINGEGTMDVGAVAGVVASSTVINNADVFADIKVEGEGTKIAAGLVGKIDDGDMIANGVKVAGSVVVPEGAAKDFVCGSVAEGKTIAKGAVVAIDYGTMYPAADGWVAVSDLAGIKAMAANGGKYYLTNNVDITDNVGFTGWKDAVIEFAGNGFTLTWKDTDGTIFGGGGGESKLTVYDLNLAGTFKVDSEMRENAAPLLMHGYAGGATLTNVHSTVDVVFTENVKEIKNAVGGIIAKSEGPTVLNNVSYTGTITVAAKQIADYAPDFGGIAGALKGTLTAENVSSNATLNVTVEGLANVGVVVGKIYGDATIKNVTAKGAITVAGEGAKVAGPVVGAAAALTLGSWKAEAEVTAPEGATVGTIYGTATNFTDLDHVHAFDKEVVDDKFKATDADCQNKATYFKSCECGEKGEETFEAGELDPTKHTKDTFTYTDNGDGKHTKKNECCGAVVAADEAHTYGDDDKCVCGAAKPTENTKPGGDDKPGESNKPTEGNEANKPGSSDSDSDGGTEPAKKKGCKSAITGAAIVVCAVATLGAAVSFKKKED